jgi:periplasmic divalent cation tolerance protein
MPDLRYYLGVGPDRSARKGNVKMSDYIEVRSTTDSREEADKICVAVVEPRLAAFAQVAGPIRSTYWWQGKIERAEEYFLMMKTTRDKFGDLARVIRENHSYDVPDIVAVPIVEGTCGLPWLDCAETRAPGASA